MFGAAGEAREAVVSRIRDRIVRVAASRMRSREPDDLAQRVVMVLMTKYPHVTDEAELVRIGVGILTRLNFGAVRAEIRHGGVAAQVDEMPLESGELNPEELLARKQVAETVASGLSQLAGKCQRLLRMWMGGRRAAQIAADDGKTVNAVNVAISQCKAALRKILVRNEGRRL